MNGRHLFGELTRYFTPERRARVDARKAELRAAMPLHELRQARAMTQKAIGKVLEVNQPVVTKLERRAVAHRRRVSTRQRGHYQLLRRR